MASARQNIQRDQTLQFVNAKEAKRSIMQSMEGPLQERPRPRFKINEGFVDQVESIMSHFSQSEINNDTEGQEPVANTNITHTILPQEAISKVKIQKNRSGLNSSTMEQRPRGDNLLQSN